MKIKPKILHQSIDIQLMDLKKKIEKMVVLLDNKIAFMQK